MYSGYNGYNGNFAVDQPTLKPNYSIDQVIERVHVVAGSVNELTHVATNYANQVVNKGEDTLDRFNVHFKNISSNVGEIIEISRDRFYGIPLDVFYAFLICALIAIVLGILYVLLFGTHHFLRRRYTNVQPKVV
ncbi:hypothetical protein M3Y97_00106900 [Aphelenchoides bicaudatus]|nr:hypothetical protein M3Y97_00106900 [Aphelenchoides bicaudatus]